MDELRVHNNWCARARWEVRLRVHARASAILISFFSFFFFSESISVAGKMEGTAYGAGRAGGAFDPLTFLQQPHTVLRMVSWVSARALFTISPGFLLLLLLAVRITTLTARRALGTRTVYAARALVSCCLNALKR